MKAPQVSISPRQGELLDAVYSRKYDQIFLIGALATSKTYAFALTLILLCWRFEGSYIPVARKTLAEIKVGTLFSFLEVLDHLGFEEGKEYKFTGGVGGSPMIQFSNKSIINFIQLDHTIDRDWHKIKSINATAAGVDEVDGVVESGFIMLGGRVGRKNQNGAPAVTIATCNPNETWVKENIYLPWRQGKLNKKIKVIEFQMTDSYLYAEGFYNKYDGNPNEWKERYLRNNWEYLDDDTSIFKTRILDSIGTNRLDVDADHILGIDVAREGKDRSVFAHVQGNVLKDIKIYAKEDLERLATPNEKKAIPYSNILGREVMFYAENNRIGYDNIGADAVGLGAGLIDYLRGKEFPISEYKAGAQASVPKLSQAEKDMGRKAYPAYDMLRSEIADLLARDMQNGQFFFYEGCPFLGDLKRELLLHQYEDKDRVRAIESKSKLKERLGRSPDIADAVFIAYWVMKCRGFGSFQSTPEPDEDEDEVQMITHGLINRDF